MQGEVTRLSVLRAALRRAARRTLVAGLALALAAGSARAQPEAPPPAPDLERASTVDPAPAPTRHRPQGRALLLASEGLPRVQTTPLPQPVPMDPQKINEPPPVDRWWFWAAVGGLVVGTGLLLLVVTRDDGTPSTRLGNMEVFD